MIFQHSSSTSTHGNAIGRGSTWKKFSPSKHITWPTNKASWSLSHMMHQEVFQESLEYWRTHHGSWLYEIPLTQCVLCQCFHDDQGGTQRHLKNHKGIHALIRLTGKHCLTISTWKCIFPKRIYLLSARALWRQFKMHPIFMQTNRANSILPT